METVTWLADGDDGDDSDDDDDDFVWQRSQGWQMANDKVVSFSNKATVTRFANGDGQGSCLLVT